MTTLDFCAKYISFSKTSPITGPFRIQMYPFLRKPMDAADDIRVKRLIIFKASSTMGTILGQCINAKRISKDVGDQLMVCQTEDDAAKWQKTRGKEWLESIPDVMRLLKTDKYSRTQELWLFRHKFLSISGPGINAAQSVQVRYVQTDESHLEAYPQGRLVEFEKRMGGRFDAQATHITTAPDEGREVDGFYNTGSQEEWHWRCPKCNQLVWPLWEERSRQHYNGERIFQWKEFQSETATLDSIIAICPHCQHVNHDNDRERYALVRDGDYVAMNPTAPIEQASFRWSVFAGHWIPWRSMLAEYLAARRAALELFDLKPYEDFVKKRECFSYKPQLPDFGQAIGGTNYKLGDEWEPGTDILTGDYQAGKRGEGSHIWALVTRWDKQGNSRRITYRRCETWAQFRALQLEFKVWDSNVYVDCGYDDRTVFWQCSIYKWYATKGSDLQQFHTITVDKGKKTERKITVAMPYSQPEWQNGNVGAADRNSVKGGAYIVNAAKGWALQIVMHNPQLYGILHALQTGANGRYFGIARDMPEEYTGGFPAFIPVTEKDKKTNVEKVIWKMVKAFAHPWDCEVQALVGALRVGCFPLKKEEPQPDEPKPQELIEV